MHDGKLSSLSEDSVMAHKAETESPMEAATNPAQMTEEGKDAVTGETGEPAAAKHDGISDSVAQGNRRDDGESSDDEPLIKYTKQGATNEDSAPTTPAKVGTYPH